jgi:hypothetical protein
MTLRGASSEREGVTIMSDAERRQNERRWVDRPGESAQLRATVAQHIQDLREAGDDDLAALIEAVAVEYRYYAKRNWAKVRQIGTKASRFMIAAGVVLCFYIAFEAGLAVEELHLSHQTRHTQQQIQQSRYANAVDSCRTDDTRNADFVKLLQHYTTPAQRQAKNYTEVLLFVDALVPVHGNCVAFARGQVALPAGPRN